MKRRQQRPIEDVEGKQKKKRRRSRKTLNEDKEVLPTPSGAIILLDEVVLCLIRKRMSLIETIRLETISWRFFARLPPPKGRMKLHFCETKDMQQQLTVEDDVQLIGLIVQDSSTSPPISLTFTIRPGLLYPMLATIFSRVQFIRHLSFGDFQHDHEVLAFLCDTIVGTATASSVQIRALHFPDAFNLTMSQVNMKMFQRSHSHASSMSMSSFHGHQLIRFCAPWLRRLTLVMKKSQLPMTPVDSWKTHIATQQLMAAVGECWQLRSLVVPVADGPDDWLQLFAGNRQLKNLAVLDQWPSLADPSSLAIVSQLREVHMVDYSRRVVTLRSKLETIFAALPRDGRLSIQLRFNRPGRSLPVEELKYWISLWQTSSTKSLFIVYYHPYMKKTERKRLVKHAEELKRQWPSMDFFEESDLITGDDARFLIYHLDNCEIVLTENFFPH